MKATLAALLCLCASLLVTQAAEPPQNGLVLWLDAGKVEVNQDGHITKWPDQSGKEHHATAEVGPIPVPGDRAFVRFNGTTAATMKVPALRDQDGPLSVFFVARRPADLADGVQWQQLLTGAGTDGKEKANESNALTVGYSIQSKPTELAYGQVSQIDELVGAMPLVLGGSASKPGGNLLKAEVAAILVYDHAFTDPAEFEAVQDYLAHELKAEPIRTFGGWTRSEPLPPAPKRTSDALPLIDQSNAAQWQVNESLTDEFAGDKLDEAKWWDHHPSWHGRAPARFLPENIAVKDGELQLTLRKDDTLPKEVLYKENKAVYEGYSAAAVTSKKPVTYGCFEIRMKVANATPTSSWWFLGGGVDAAGVVRKNEIDVFELPAGSAGHEHNFGMNMHVFKEPETTEHWSNWGNWEAPFKWADDFHTITFVWSPEWLRYYVDGHCVRTTRNSAWHIPLNMIFDMEIMSWLPFPKDTEFPATYRVEYVRAWSHPQWQAPAGIKPDLDPNKITGTTKIVRELDAKRRAVKASALPGASKAATKPNIIVILADDLGYATTGVYGADAKRLTTPNIDRIAKEGARFTDAYVTASVCSPSRAGILTGRYQQRFGYYANIDGQKGPGAPASEKMMGRYFKDAGYATAAIGKWHVGVKLPGQHPLDRGFDKYYGFNSAQTDYFNSPILFDGRTKVTKHDYLTFQFTDEAIRFMDSAKDNPFFIYLAYNAVHGPNQAPPEYVARFAHLPEKERTQAAMVAALDDSVGRVLDALKRNGQEDNTLVYFLSDNGGLPTWWKGSNDPWRGWKREQWEGGDHVQFLMRWPGHIPAGQVRSELVSSLDILTTSLAAADIPVPPDAQLDGANLLPIFATTEKQIVHPSLFWGGSHYDRVVTGWEKGGEHDNPPPAWAVRSGPWKLMQIIEKGPPMLFNIEADPTESKDVSAENADVMQRLTTEFRDWFKDMAKPIAWEQKYFEQLKEVK